MHYKKITIPMRVGGRTLLFSVGVANSRRQAQGAVAVDLRGSSSHLVGLFLIIALYLEVNAIPVFLSKSLDRFV